MKQLKTEAEVVVALVFLLEALGLEDLILIQRKNWKILKSYSKITAIEPSVSMAYRGKFTIQLSGRQSESDLRTASAGWYLSQYTFKLLAWRFSAAFTSTGIILPVCCTTKSSSALALFGDK